jgi:hypothetical protein
MRVVVVAATAKPVALQCRWRDSERDLADLFLPGLLQRFFQEGCVKKLEMRPKFCFKNLIRGYIENVEVKVSCYTP